VGISRDTIDKQKRFADKHAFDYPLLADVDGQVAEIFGVQRGGVLGKFSAGVKRWTFAIGTDRKVVAAIHSEVNMDLHADQALKAFARS
jgi:thioredoxin-dependent peroxiredoxin